MNKPICSRNYAPLTQMIIGAVILCLCLLLMTPLSPLFAADRALIIGVNKYKYLEQRYQLTGAVNDARGFVALARDIWKFKPDQIKLLLDEKANAANIVENIENWLIKSTKAGDRVLLFYSGHGFYRRDKDGDESDGLDETLAPFDVRANGKIIQNMISDDEIGALLKKLAGRKVMVIIDSCHSGTVSRGLSAGEGKRKAIIRSLGIGQIARSLDGSSYERHRNEGGFVQGQADLTVWSAVAASQKAHEDMSMGPQERQGLFSHNFIKGLRDLQADGNKNGHVSAAELLTFLRTNADDYCQSHLCQTPMTPTLEADKAYLTQNLLAWGGSHSDRPQVTGSKSPALAPIELLPSATPNDTDASAPEEPQTSEPPNRTQPASAITIADLLPKVENGDVRVEILPRAALQIGETLKIRVTSRKRGWLILLDIRHDGKIMQLFPNKFSARRTRQLQVESPLTLPDASYGFEFTADEPGSGSIIAILTQDNVPLDALLGKNKDLSLIAGEHKTPYLNELAQNLLSVWTRDKENRSVRWSLGEGRYEITD